MTMNASQAVKAHDAYLANPPRPSKVDRVAWFCKCGLTWRFSGTMDGYDLLYEALTKHLRQGPPHRLLMNPVKQGPA